MPTRSSRAPRPDPLFWHGPIAPTPPPRARRGAPRVEPAPRLLFLAVLGFLTGVSAALVLTALGSDRPLSATELHLLWPTASLGLDFADWADGNLWHFLRLLLIYAGNGLLYAAVACVFGALAELARG